MRRARGNLLPGPLAGDASGTVTYRGTTAVYHAANGQLTTDVDITSLGLTSLTKSAPKLKGFTTNGCTGQARLLLTSPTNLRVITYASVGTYTVTVEWEIEVGEGLSVVHLTTTHTTSGGDYCAETNEPIASVGDTSKAEAICNGATTGTNLNVTAKVKLTSATNLNVRDFAGAGSVSVTAESVILKRAA